MHAGDVLDAGVEPADGDCVLPYYDIEYRDDPFGPGEAPTREAAGEEYDVTIETRRVVLSDEPHEVNVCLDARLEREGV